MMGFLVPEDCSTSNETLGNSPLDIAKAYDVECASILVNGPQEPRSNCEGKQAANSIFNQTFERMQSITQLRS